MSRTHNRRDGAGTTRRNKMKSLKMLGLTAISAMALMAVVAGSASATTLEVGGVTQNNAVTIESSLAAGSTAILKDKNGTTNDTCTLSSTKATTEKEFTGTWVGGKVSSLTFSGCTHTTHVLAPGSLFIDWTSKTNGTVKSSEAEVTVKSTVFGVSAVC